MLDHKNFAQFILFILSSKWSLYRRIRPKIDQFIFYFNDTV